MGSISEYGPIPDCHKAIVGIATHRAGVVPLAAIHERDWLLSVEADGQRSLRVTLPAGNDANAGIQGVVGGILQ